ncbi:MAG: hypothetical protein OXN27_00885 [Candidatus Poribacteria bacterium]|nr:hypothetical protein [Candidatus Poribacteria bacterium]
MKRFGQYVLKIATFTTVLTFMGLLLLNAGWISPHPIYASIGSSSSDHQHPHKQHTATAHSYTDVPDWDEHYDGHTYKWKVAEDHSHHD